MKTQDQSSIRPFLERPQDAALLTPANLLGLLEL